ncbi:hypothetical protein NFI96_007620 [Prochilodus magdalenae]|nr:hypothetical protein NFI96_007620 [Prochilodus magdalenae]
MFECRLWSEGALGQARRGLDSARSTLQRQKERKRKAEIVTGVGLGVTLIPFPRMDR